jgi:hypothetical protein
MRHGSFVACAAVALAILTSPVGAQTVPPDQSPYPETSVPPAPPPDRARQPAPELPPFIPPPRARIYDHHRTTAHRRATPHHRPTAHNRATAHHRVTAHHVTHSHHPAVHLSKATMRQCHKMTYRQIMRNSSCRALMSQDLAAAERHHATTHHRAKTAHHSTKHHRRHGR